MRDELNMDSYIDQASTITDAVKKRVQDEEAIYPDTSLNHGKIHTRFIEECLDANELGDGVLYSELHRNQFIFNVTSKEWLRWTGQYWEYDEHNQALAATEDIVTLLLEQTTELSKEIDSAIRSKDKDLKARLEMKRDTIYKRISRLRTDRGRNPCLKFAIRADPDSA